MAKNTAGDGIRRFPRLPNAFDSGKTTRRIWKTPVFEFRPVGNETEFVYRLPFLIPERIREKHIPTFVMLFESQSIDLKAEVESAYPKTKYRGKSVAKLIGGSLRAVVNTAIAEVFMKAKQSKDPNAKYMEGTQEEFLKASRPVRKPDIRRKKQRAIRLARLDLQVRPVVAKIRRLVRGYQKDGEQDDSKCRTRLEKDFSHKWVELVTQGAALQNMPDMGGSYSRSTDSLIDLDWTERQLRIGMIKCLEDQGKNEPKLSANTILEDYLPLGKQLLKK